MVRHATILIACWAISAGIFAQEARIEKATAFSNATKSSLVIHYSGVARLKFFASDADTGLFTLDMPDVYTEFDFESLNIDQVANIQQTPLDPDTSKGLSVRFYLGEGVTYDIFEYGKGELTIFFETPVAETNLAASPVDPTPWRPVTTDGDQTVAAQITGTQGTKRLSNLLVSSGPANGQMLLAVTELSDYKTFRLIEPLRFVIDLKDTLFGLDANELEVAQGPVRRVRVRQFQSHPEPITRVVLDLEHDEVIESHRVPQGVLLTFGLGEDDVSVANQDAAVPMSAPPVDGVDESMTDPDVVEPEMTEAVAKAQAEEPAIDGQDTQVVAESSPVVPVEELTITEDEGSIPQPAAVEPEAEEFVASEPLVDASGVATSDVATSEADTVEVTASDIATSDVEPVAVETKVVPETTETMDIVENDVKPESSLDEDREVAKPAMVVATDTEVMGDVEPEASIPVEEATVIAETTETFSTDARDAEMETFLAEDETTEVAVQNNTDIEPVVEQPVPSEPENVVAEVQGDAVITEPASAMAAPETAIVATAEPAAPLQSDVETVTTDPTPVEAPVFVAQDTEAIEPEANETAEAQPVQDEPVTSEAEVVMAEPEPMQDQADKVEEPPKPVVQALDAIEFDAQPASEMVEEQDPLFTVELADKPKFSMASDLDMEMQAFLEDEDDDSLYGMMKNTRSNHSSINSVVVTNTTIEDGKMLTEARTMQEAGYFEDDLDGQNFAELFNDPLAGVGEVETIAGGEKEYRGVEISIIDVKDADVVDLLRFIAERIGFNLYVDPSVQNLTATYSFRNIPWDQALDIILANANLDKEFRNGVLRVATLEKFQQEESQRAQLREQRELSVPRETVTFSLNYANASEVEPLVSEYLSARGNILTDQRTNTLIIEDIPSRMTTIRALIRKLDRMIAQVSIEARLVETNKRFLKELGIQWGLSAQYSPENGTDTGIDFPNRVSVGGPVIGAVAPGNIQGGYAVNFPVVAENASGFGLTLGNFLDNFKLDISLQMLESEGFGQIISAPKITTQNNQTAIIKNGQEVPIQTIQRGTVTIRYIDAVLELQVTPHITADETIIMDLIVDKSEPDFTRTVQGNPVINVRRAETKVLVKNGGTAVIGGIFTLNEQNSGDGIPGLRKVPILKKLFGRELYSYQNQELLIFITPKIVKY